jgi:hypothetical protein
MSMIAQHHDVTKVAGIAWKPHGEILRIGYKQPFL